MCGFFSNAWNMTKKAAGAASKYLLNNEGVRDVVSKGLGLAASQIPVIGSSVSSQVQKAVSKGLDKLNSYVNDVPEGNVKTSLKAIVPRTDRAMKTNQYRSANAVSSAADGTVYGQSTHPVYRERRNFGDGITVSAPRVERATTKRRAKKSKKRVKRKDNRK